MHEAPGTVSMDTAGAAGATTEHGGFHVRPYRKGDGPAINSGFNEIFAQQRPLVEWSWKFQPEAGDCWITVAIDQCGELIAHFGVVRQLVQIGGKVFCAGQAMDVYRLKRPATAETRVFTATVEDFYRRYGHADTISFLFGFPGERHLAMGRDRLGYADPVPVPVWRRPVAAGRLGWRPYSVSRGCDTASLDELWKRSAHRYPVAVVRDGERLARRYLSRPGHEYFQLAAGNRQSVSAWGVLKQTEGMLEWIDLLWDGNDKQALIALDDAADKIAEDNKADRLELWLAHDDKAAEVLESRGWVVGAHAQDLHMTSISFDPEVNEKWLLDHFYFTKGDSDLV